MTVTGVGRDMVDSEVTSLGQALLDYCISFVGFFVTDNVATTLFGTVLDLTCHKAL
jgi:hypothetical protein